MVPRCLNDCKRDIDCRLLKCLGPWAQGESKGKGQEWAKGDALKVVQVRVSVVSLLVLASG